MNKNEMPVKIFIVWTLLLLSSLFLPDIADAGGWYVRGGGGYEKSLQSNFTDTDCSSTNPPALFGCANGSDGQPIGAYGDFGHFPLLELALGRQFLPWLRADLAISYRFNMNYEGNANFLSVGVNQPVSAKADSLSGMVNVFVDISGLLAGKKLWRFQPYVGGGAGMSYNRIGEMTFEFPENPRAHKTSITPSGDRKDFAFMLAVGTGVMLTDSLSLDIAYRYVDLGRVGTSPGNMYMNTVPQGIVVNDIETRLRAHGPAVGLRYSF